MFLCQAGGVWGGVGFGGGVGGRVGCVRLLLRS